MNSQGVSETYSLGMRFIALQRVTADDILSLRHSVLRPGMHRSKAQYAVDDDPATLHFAATDFNHPLCCVTYVAGEWEGEPAYQLRGMATRADVRGRGIGRRLLAFSEKQILAMQLPLLHWCNARSHAVGFYVSQGWSVASDEFMIETVGPHFKLVKRLERTL